MALVRPPVVPEPEPADNGNMSAATARFILCRRITARLPSRTLLTAMGPGVTASGVSRLAGTVLPLRLVSPSRPGELWLARTNTGALVTPGAVEVAAGHDPAIVALQASRLGGLSAFGLNQSMIPVWHVVFPGLRVGRVRVQTTLGQRGTPRILIVPGEQPETRGPSRSVSHPNDVMLAGKIAVLPLCRGLPWLDFLFTLRNAAVPGVRIRAENAGLHDVRSHAPG